MADRSPPAAELNTWQEIANHLHVSVRQAQYWEKNDGMPVRRMPGKKSRVSADTSALDAWKSEVSAIRLRAPNGSDPAVTGAPTHAVESPVVPASPITETQGVRGPSGPDGPGPVAAQSRISSLSRRSALAGTFIGLGGMIAVGTAVMSWRRREITSLKVEGPSLIATDAAGKEMWRHLFGDGLYASDYQAGSFNGTCWIGDLDGDGHAEALFIQTPANTARQTSALLCFSRTGEVKWVFRPGRAVRDGRGDILPRYRIPAFLVSFSAGPERLARIVVTGTHVTRQACQLAFLDRDGRLVAEYWHPGHLWNLAEFRPGGSPRLLAAGVNNGEHRATLVALDPFAMKGVSTPFRVKDQKYRLLEMPEAHEESVILFPRRCLSRDEPYTRAQAVVADSQVVLVTVIESAAVSQRVIYYEFDPSLVLRRAFLSTEYRHEHLLLERAGALTHPSDADEMTLSRDIEIRRKKAYASRS